MKREKYFRSTSDHQLHVPVVVPGFIFKGWVADLTERYGTNGDKINSFPFLNFDPKERGG